MTLNAEQQPIVGQGIDGTVKVLAGAGTGKTRVLVERYLRFVYQDRVEPDRLLALTFTKKAAAEMHTRIFKVVSERGDKNTLRKLYGAWIMNFHQFAFRLIKENAAAFGVDPDIDAATEIDLERIRRILSRRFESGSIDGLPDDYGNDAPIPTELNEKFERYMRVVDKAKGLLWTPEELAATVQEKDFPEYARIIQTIVAVWNAYDGELIRRGLLDFSDMIRLVVFEMRDNAALRDRYRNRFAHILVDEFQDTSEAQNELLRLLSGDDYSRVTVVGDEKQSIYRWRDARVENLREFDKGHEFYLKTNYRSTQGILDLAYRFIATDPYFEKLGDAIHLAADRGASEAPICVFHPADEIGRSADAEARALAAWILSITGSLTEGTSPFPYYRAPEEPLGFGDVAVLMRSIKDASGLPEYEKEFQRVGIPYAIFGGVSALEHQVLELFKNQLGLLIDPDNVKGLLSLLEARPFSIADASLRRLFDTGERTFDVNTLLSAENLSRLDDKEVARRCAVLRESLAVLDEKRYQLELPGFIADALEMTQVYFQLFEGGADLKFVDSVTKSVVELVDNLMLSNEGSLSAFLESLQTLLDKRAWGESDTPFFPSGRVRIMTVHQAKGLEFPAVAVPGIKKPPGSKDAFVLARGRGLYINSAKDYMRGTEHAGDGFDGTVAKAQEERCLLYVAMTRAERYLFVSSPYPGGLERGKKSNFATVLDVLAAHKLLYEELRHPPTLSPVRERRSVESGRKRVDFGALLDDWQAGRRRLEAVRSQEARLPEGLQFVSWRGLRAFERCPLQYYYRHIVGVEHFDEVDMLASPDDAAEGFAVRSELADEDDRKRFGVLMHRFLFEWMGAPSAAAYETRLTALVEASDIAPAKRGRVKEMAMALAEAYLHSEMAARDNVLHRELPVQARVGNIVYHGVVDRVDRANSGQVVIDYKGKEQRPEYTYQITFYAWLLNKLDGYSVKRGQLCYLRATTFIDAIDITQRDVDAIETTAAALGEAMTTGYFPADPGEPCGTCISRSFCPFVSEQAGEVPL